MKNVARALLVSIAGGLVGPAMRFATWPLVGVSWRGEGGQPWRYLSELVYHLTLLLWPAQPLAVYEASIGILMAGVLAVGANLILFVLLGMIVVAASFVRWMSIAVASLFFAAVIWWELLGSSFDVEFLHFPALLIGLAYYGAFVFVVGHVARRGRILPFAWSAAN